MSNDGKAIAHIAQHIVARLLQWFCLIAGFALSPWKGYQAIVLGVAGFVFFGFAKPAPDQTLDKASRRD